MKPEAKTTAELDSWLSEHRTELLFNEVPDEELAACFTWESLREIRDEDIKREGPNGISSYGARLLVDPGEELIQFSTAARHVPLGVLQWIVMAVPHRLLPWQQLPQTDREDINHPMRSSWPALIPLFLDEGKTLSWKFVLPPLPPEKWNVASPEQEKDTLAYLSRASLSRGRRMTTRAESVENKKSEFIDTPLAIDNPLSWLLARINCQNVTPFPFLINWDDFTDAEILEEVGKWLQQERSKRMSPPESAKAAYAAIRHSLRDIAAARILQKTSQKEFGWTEFFNEFQKPLGERKRPKGWMVDLKKSRKSAESKFTAYFALMKGQKMLSYSPPRRGPGSQAHKKGV